MTIVSMSYDQIEAIYQQYVDNTKHQGPFSDWFFEQTGLYYGYDGNVAPPYQAIADSDAEAVEFKLKWL